MFKKERKQSYKKNQRNVIYFEEYYFIKIQIFIHNKRKRKRKKKNGSNIIKLYKYCYIKKHSILRAVFLFNFIIITVGDLK